MRRKGFSIIELLVVMGILAVIASIAAYSFNRVSRSAKVKATHATMEGLRAILAETERPQYGLDLPGSFNGATDVVRTVNVAGTDYRVPLMVDENHDNGVIIAGNINVGVMGRYGEAVLKTHRFLQKASRIPANRTAMQSLPPESITSLMWAPDVYYEVGDIVKSDGIFYTCTLAGTSPKPTSGGSWVLTPTTTFVAPLLLDGWHNPIILVGYPTIKATYSDPELLLSYGMYPVNVTGANYRRIVNPSSVAFSPTDWDGIDPLSYTYPGDPPEARRTTVIANLNQIYRPFFASAGPDGVFSTNLAGDKPMGDDNEYSQNQ